jgi:Ion channel
MTSPRHPTLSPPRLIDRLVRFWRSESGLSIFSAALIVLVFVLPPFLPPGTDRSFATEAAFALVLLTGVLALSERGLAWWLLMAAALVAVGVLLANRVLEVAEPVIRGAEFVSLLLLLLVVLGQTFRAGPVTGHRVQGGIAGYLLLGLVWAQAYALVEMLHPGSFSGAITASAGHRSFVYFSFVTLTTVGYGDILPVHPGARSLAMLEAVTGPLYVAILLARLVSLAMASPTESAGGAGASSARGKPP